MDDENFVIFEFSKISHWDSVSENVTRRIEQDAVLSDLLREFKWFLQNCGFTYVDSVEAYAVCGHKYSSEEDAL